MKHLPNLTRKRISAASLVHFRLGFTLVEVIIAGGISAATAIALAALTITVSRMEKALFYQQLFLKRGQSAIEGLNREIRLSTTPLRVVDESGNPVLRGNCVLFSRLGEAAYRRSIRLISTDENLMTPWDNSLVYDPDTTVAHNEVVIARWVSPINGTGVFSYGGAMTPLAVRMRAGDPVGVNPRASNAHTGPGVQGVEINITVAPRN
jgi:hypothetical protein